MFGSARFVITGVSARKNGLSASIERLIDWPRPAKASPKPGGGVLDVRRVVGSKVENRSSNSSGSEAFFTGIVSPDVKVLLARAGLELDVLEPERRARPHAQLRVHAERLDLLVEREVRERDGAPLAVHGRDRRA